MLEDAGDLRHYTFRNMYLTFDNDGFFDAHV